MDEPTETTVDRLIALTTEVVTAYVANNSVRWADLADLIATTHAALADLGAGGAAPEPAVEKPTPAQVRRSVTREALISFEDGRPYKTLRRHLASKGITPEAYRAKWGLPSDYPMTAVGYSETRSALAKSLGLGQARRRLEEAEAAPTPAVAPEEAPKRRGRATKAPTSRR